MSVVAVRKYPDKIIIAADSIIVQGWSKKTNNDFSKINKDNGMIIGSCGYAMESGFMWNYMATHKPSSPSVKDVLNFIIEFSKWKNDLSGNSTIQNSYLMVFEGHVFNIQDMFVEEINNYTAIGAGEDFANAALYLGHSPKEAVKVACDLCCFVAEPILEFVYELNNSLCVDNDKL